jgi:hypothetical protein
MRIRTVAIAIAVAATLAVAGVLAAAAFRPDTFRIERSVTVHARAQAIHPLINDLRQFNSWNPFNKKDPAIRGTYRGPTAGPGAAYDFAGNSEVGQGTVEITGSTPERITMALRMVEPMKADNQVEFTLRPRGDVTDVTWSMQGRTPYFAKVIHVVFDMDKMVGASFEAGLAELKARAERSPA